MKKTEKLKKVKKNAYGTTDSTGSFKKVMCAKAGLIHTIGICGENSNCNQT